MTMSLEPCGYRVIVEPDSGERESEGGIVLVDTKGRMEQDFGTLVAVGPLAWTDHGDGKPWAKVGDRVGYAKYGGKMIGDPDTGRQYRILSDEDINVVVNKTMFDEDYHEFQGVSDE